MDIGSAHWKALDRARGIEPTPASLDRLAAQVGQEVARWAFSQWRWRQRAKAKFALADEMLFTAEALEQASHERVAAYHASLFVPGEPVVDLTVGIGSDLIALARRGPAIGFEIDGERAAYARHNLRVHGVSADVIVSDALAADLSAYSGVFVDPSRRSEGRRLRKGLESYLPAPSAVLGRVLPGAQLVFKLSPLDVDPELESLGKVRFLSFGRECREALVERGDRGRSAVHVESGAELEATEAPPRSEVPQAWLHELDPAAIRAGAAGRLGWERLGDAPAYLTGQVPLTTVWANSHRVLGQEKADVKRLKALLAKLGGRVVAVKSSGPPQEAEAWCRRLATQGDRHVAVALYPVGRSLRAAVLDWPHA